MLESSFLAANFTSAALTDILVERASLESSNFAGASFTRQAFSVVASGASSSTAAAAPSGTSSSNCTPSGCTSMPARPRRARLRRVCARFQRAARSFTLRCVWRHVAAAALQAELEQYLDRPAKQLGKSSNFFGSMMKGAASSRRSGRPPVAVVGALLHLQSIQ